MAEAEYWRFTVARDCQKKNTSETHSGYKLALLPASTGDRTDRCSRRVLSHGDDDGAMVDHAAVLDVLAVASDADGNDVDRALKKLRHKNRNNPDKLAEIDAAAEKILKALAR